jgi:cytochrome c oxidase assembly protein subunit 15
VANKTVGVWLLVLTFMVFGMAAGAGHAREIGAGFALQIWRPITGFIPPITAQDWSNLFTLFQSTTQYQAHPITMAAFKTLVWPMYLDRLWGRLMALVFLIPFGIFLAQGRISRALALRLAAIFLAGAAEAVFGWYIVLTGRQPGILSPPPAWVAPHFAAAILIFAALLWTALSELYPTPAPTAGPKHWLSASVILLITTMSAGSLVAATHAISVYNSFPLMDGHLIPVKYLALQPGWQNFIINQATVQFDHRLLATITAFTVLTTAALGLRADLPQPFKDLFLLMAALVFVQFLLGMVTILSGSKTLGYIHGLTAFALLATTLTLRFHLRQTKLRQLLNLPARPKTS